VPEPDEAEAEYEAAYPALFMAAMRLAYRILHDRDAAEDIAAEAMARAYAHWRTVRALAHREAWVLRVAANLAIDVVRRQGPVLEPLLADGFEDATAARVALTAALDALPRRQREALVLHFVGGMTEVEASATMGIDPSSVRTHIQRGLAAMRRQMQLDIEGGAHGAE